MLSDYALYEVILSIVYLYNNSGVKYNCAVCPRILQKYATISKCNCVPYLHTLMCGNE